jgi:hypothetical protein
VCLLSLLPDLFGASSVAVTGVTAVELKSKTHTATMSGHKGVSLESAAGPVAVTNATAGFYGSIGCLFYQHSKSGWSNGCDHTI